METKIAIFKGKEVRKTIYNNEWWFSVIDVVEVLTDSVNPRDYWYKMKIRIKDEGGFELSTNCRQLKLVLGFLEVCRTIVTVLVQRSHQTVLNSGDASLNLG